MRDGKAMTKAARQVYDRLKSAAKNTGQDAEAVRARFAYERFLARVSGSRWEDGWAFKGGLLLLSLGGGFSRTTGDIDLSVRDGHPDDLDALVAALSDIATVVPAEEDGFKFEVLPNKAKLIREMAEAPTARVFMRAVLRCAGGGYRDCEVRFMVDATREEILRQPSAATWTPTIKGFLPVRVPAYAWESVFAEKLHAAVTGGPDTHRLRDFADIVAISRAGVLDAGRAAVEVAATFTARNSWPCDPVMLEDLSWTEARQSKWADTLKTRGIKGVPEDLGETVREVAAVALPILTAAAALDPDPFVGIGA